jgi:hypothetical protein
MGSIFQQLEGTVAGAKTEASLNSLLSGISSNPFVSSLLSESPTAQSAVSFVSLLAGLGSTQLGGASTPAAPAPTTITFTLQQWSELQQAWDEALTSLGAPTSADPQFVAAVTANLTAIGWTIPPPQAVS